MSNLSILITLFRQEWKEVSHSKLLWLVSLVYLGFFLIFVLVGSRESSIMGFTGINRVLFSWSHALVFFLPLLALTASVTSIVQYRENGSLEFFHSLPISRDQFFLSLSLARLTVMVLPLVVITLISLAWGLVSELGFSLSYGIKFLGVSGSLLWCFLAAGLYISERSRSQVRGIVMMILLWVASITLMDFIVVGLILKFSLNSETLFFLSHLNPIQSVRLALLIDLDTSLSTLGPVGFFIANRIGEGMVLLLGMAWPLLIGTCFWFITKKNFAREDLV